MEPEGSIPHSQVPITCLYHQSAQSSSYSHIPLPEDPSKYCPPIYAWVSPFVSFLQVSPTKILYTPLPSPLRATCPAYLILLDWSHRNCEWAVQITKLFIMKFYPLPCYLVPMWLITEVLILMYVCVIAQFRSSNLLISNVTPSSPIPYLYHPLLSNPLQGRIFN
jgi:hypothetical protein